MYINLSLLPNFANFFIQFCKKVPQNWPFCCLRMTNLIQFGPFGLIRLIQAGLGSISSLSRGQNDKDDDLKAWAKFKILRIGPSTFENYILELTCWFNCNLTLKSWLITWDPWPQFFLHVSRPLFSGAHNRVWAPKKANGSAEFIKPGLSQVHQFTT